MLRWADRLPIKHDQPREESSGKRRCLQQGPGRLGGPCGMRGFVKDIELQPIITPSVSLFTLSRFSASASPSSICPWLPTLTNSSPPPSPKPTSSSLPLDRHSR